MSSITEQIRLVFEAVTGRATTEIAKLDRSLDQAGKSTSGLQGQLNRATQFLANNWQTAAVAGGTAVAAFAAKSVKAFEGLALAADKFSASSGLAVEDASRWIEVADDLGVNSEAVSAAMIRLNRAAASGDLAKFGVATNDANERLLQTLQRLAAITDETKRAEVAQKLLGRGGLDALAPLVARAGELRDRLADVSKQKVITDEERQKARQLADAMDGLKDSVDDVTLAVGEGLTPAVVEVAQDIEHLKSAVSVPSALSGGWINLGNAFRFAADMMIPGFTAALDARKALSDTGDAAKLTAEQLSKIDSHGTAALVRLEAQAKAAAKAAEDLADAQKEAADRAEMLAKAAEDGAAREAKAREKAAAARQAGHDIPSAELDLRDAERSLQQAIRDRDDAMKSSQSTLDDEADRLRSIADAQRDVADAQERVTEAREKAVRDRRDSARDIERAEIRLADAKRELQKAGNSNTDDGFKDALDRVRLAELDLQDARDRAGERAVDDQRDIQDAQDNVREKVQKVADLETKLQKDRAKAAAEAKKDLVDQAELADRIARAMIAVADAQLRLNNLRREAVGASPITPTTTPAAARYADSLIGAGQSGPRVDPITGVIPIKGREGGSVVQQTNNFTIYEASNPRKVAAEVDRILGSAMVSGNFAGKLKGPQ